MEMLISLQFGNLIGQPKGLVMKKESVNHPSHYNSGKIETIEYLKDMETI